MNLRVIIADDEPLSLSRLKRIVSKQADVEIVAEAQNGEQLLLLINRHLPDLVITDIRMPGKTGLEAAIDACQQWDTPPAFIFCTAYPDYAVAAYETLAVGYLVKPIEEVKLVEAIERVGDLNQAQLNAAKDQSGGKARILIEAAGKLESFDLDDIDYFQANDKSVFAYINGRSITLDKSLTELEESLAEQVVRIHRSTLVNVSRIKRIYQTEKGSSSLETQDGQHLAISRRLMTDVKNAFKAVVS